MNKSVVFSLLLAAALSGCSSLQSPAALSSDSNLVYMPSEIKFEPIKSATTRPYSVNGVTYYPQTSQSTPLTEEGIASWYGPGFHNKRTSTGEVFNENSISAAHKTLSLPCYVKVINEDNGKWMIIRVNDRGPFVPGRILDLSKGAAKLLGVYQVGTAHVRISKITRPDQIPQGFSVSNESTYSGGILNAVKRFFGFGGGSVANTVATKRPFDLELSVRKELP